VPQNPENLAAAVWKKLSELANSGQIGVLMICPDDHYCRMAVHQISTLR
jgi:hypothetical protein